MQLHITLNELSPGSIIEFINAVAALLTVMFLWKYRKSEEVKYLIFLELLIVIWALTYALEFASSDLPTKVLWSKLSYLGIAFSPVCYYLFATAFSQKNHLITPGNISLLSVIPFVTIVLVFTNEYHHLIWTKVTLDSKINIAHYYHGTWFWVYFIFAQALIFGGLYNLFSSIYKFTAYYKSQVTTLVIATVIPVVGNLMYVSKLNPFPGFDWTPVSFVFTGAIVAFGVVRYRIFDLVPFARNELFDIIEDGVIVVNSEGFIEDCNKTTAAIFGFNEKSVIHKSFKIIFGKYTVLTSNFNKEKASRAELIVGSKNEERYFQVRISPLYNKFNKFSGNMVLLHDITGLKKAEYKLLKMNKQLLREIDKREKLIDDLDSFAHTVAHDLRSSLGSIVSSSEMMEDGVDEMNKPFLKQMSGLIKKAAKKTMHTTQELLILATVSHQDIKKQKLQMADIFKEAKLELSALIEEYGASVSEPDTWPESMGHAPWIEEVWINYLSNAIKYGGNPPVIEVGAEILKDNKIKFWIKDNGQGLKREEQEKLFNKHVRLQPEKAEGYGLGLSIVKRIVEKLDGTTGVESTGIPGEGSRFYFVLSSN